MANMFNEDGTYNKTEWKTGDRITAVKLNKIELSLEAINNNDIDRHVEADSRLDALEESIGDFPTRNELKTVETLVEDNIDAVEGRVGKAEVRVGTVEVHLDSVKGRVDAVEGRVGKAEVRVGTVEAHLDTVKGRVDEVEVQLDSVKGRVDAVEGRVSKVEGRVGTVEVHLDSVKGRVDELENSKTNVNAMFPPNGMSGCKCDLKSDDTEALQNIINYVYQKGGGMVYIPNSILLSNVIIEPGVTLSMEPMAVKYAYDMTQTKYIKKKSGSSGTLLTFRPYSKGVNITIEGNKDNASGDGILFENHSQGTDIYVSKCGGHGLTLKLGVMLNNVHSSYNGSRGLYVAGSDSVVSNFYSYGNNEGLYFDSGVSNCNFCNGKIEWNGVNISAYYSSENYLSNINIDRSTLWGLRLIGGNHYFSNCRLWRNYSSTNEPTQGSAHIYIEGGSSVFISNSSITIGADDGKTEPTSPNYVFTGWNTATANVYLSNCNLVNCSKTNIISPFSGSSIAINKNNCME